ncbi:hypothetical protein PVL29_001391 [Vitis rotundifolia]|uniref:Uncharacterized protein n=1 Tax=Vitis rotundifolia TaxID=103349 RepID=A0AA39E9M8_VITRO|nr:hypothetical protein PVL29_001391 [Vitis rotundifolia]
MIPEVNETNGATEVNEDKHLVHLNRFRTSKKDALKAPKSVNRSRIPRQIVELEAELSRFGNPATADAERKLSMIMEVIGVFIRINKEHLYGVRHSQSSIIPLSGLYFDMPGVSFHVAHPS